MNKELLSIEEKEYYFDALINQKDIADYKLRYIWGKLPKKIYRYRTLASEHTLNNLKNNQIRLSIPSQFNDPFDSFINMGVEDIFERNLDKEKFSLLTPIEQKAIRNSIKMEQKFCNNDMKKFRDAWVVGCFSEHKDDILMWSHYGDYHKGICVEYSFEDIASMENMYFLPILYQNKWKSMSEIDFKLEKGYRNILKLMCTKAKCWEYEKEWRIIKRYENAELSETGMMLSIPRPTAIYIGCNIENMDDKDKYKIDYLKIIAANKGIPIYNMIMSAKEYKLEVKKER